MQRRLRVRRVIWWHRVTVVQGTSPVNNALERQSIVRFHRHARVAKDEETRYQLDFRLLGDED